MIACQRRTERSSAAASIHKDFNWRQRNIGCADCRHFQTHITLIGDKGISAKPIAAAYRIIKNLQNRIKFAQMKIYLKHYNFYEEELFKKPVLA